MKFYLTLTLLSAVIAALSTLIIMYSLLVPFAAATIIGLFEVSMKDFLLIAGVGVFVPMWIVSFFYMKGAGKKRSNRSFFD